MTGPRTSAWELFPPNTKTLPALAERHRNRSCRRVRRCLTKRNVDTKLVNTVVNLVEHKYNAQRQRVVEEREIPGEHRHIRECNCESPLRAYGMAQAANAYGSAPKYVKSRH